MRPGWVQTLDEYLDAVDRRIDESGGSLERGYIEVEEVRDPAFDELVSVYMPRQRLRFADGTVLTFGLNLLPDLDVDWYSFDYRRADASLIWRHDFHPGHEEELGTGHHVHRGHEDSRHPSEPVDMFDVIEICVRAVAG